MEASTWAGIAAIAEAAGQATGFPGVGHVVAGVAGSLAVILKGGSGDKKLAAQ